MSRLLGHGDAWRNISTKNSSYAMGNRTRDLPACSSVSQPTTTPCSFSLSYVTSKFLICIIQSVTGNRLDGPGIEFRWWRDFLHLSRPALGPTQPPVQWYRVFPGGKERPGRAVDHSPPSSGHERVELYLYCPYRPYGL